ncbi:MAG: glycosyltransferase family 2 protein [Nitrospirae bacterium]|nr:glycosyltransferase family 2 protein [Nitrospirota bacterium]
MTSKLCVVIPAYNASKTIKSVVGGALKYVQKVIVADDGSTDNTASLASDAGAEVIVINKNKGKGNALKKLFQKAIEEGYKSVISMDADGQHDPDDIPLFINAHNTYREDIIVGSRMHEKEKIPRARYNSMHIARFYISFAANQFIEDTQCGFRLYPLSLIKKICLTTERYVTETEILLKAGDMGTAIRFVNIKTIYGDSESHFRPVIDVTLITAYVISYLHIKWFIEAATSNKPFTYSFYNIRDKIGKNKILNGFFQTITAFTTLPAATLFLFEYIVLAPVINNFSSIRRLGCGFFKITVATYMLPVLLGVTIIEKILNNMGFQFNFVDGFIEQFYPHLWG